MTGDIEGGLGKHSQLEPGSEKLYSTEIHPIGSRRFLDYLLPIGFVTLGAYFLLSSGIDLNSGTVVYPVRFHLGVVFEVAGALGGINQLIARPRS